MGAISLEREREHELWWENTAEKPVILHLLWHLLPKELFLIKANNNVWCCDNSC